MKSSVKAGLNFLADVIFVKRCPCCGEPISIDKDICRGCFKDLFVPKNVCRVCGEPKSKCICAKRRFLYEGFTAPFYNCGSAKNGVYSYKINSRKHAARFFGAQMAKRFNSIFRDAELDLVVSVPPNRKSKKPGGFDHAAMLARSVSDNIGVPYKRGVLKKCGNNLAQHTLSYEGRVKNVERAYKATANLTGKRILLVDDIKTTGATLNECAKQLCLAGAQRVYCVTAVLNPKKDIINSINTESQGE